MRRLNFKIDGRGSRRILTALSVGFLISSIVPMSAEESPVSCTSSVAECLPFLRESLAERGVVGFLVRPEGEQGRAIHWSVVKVIEDSAAFTSGLREGDVVVAWNDVPLPPGSPEILTSKIKVGEEVAIKALRNGQERIFSPVARAPSGEVIEAWLTTYVYEHFSRQEFDEYMATMRN